MQGTWGDHQQEARAAHTVRASSAAWQVHCRAHARAHMGHTHACVFVAQGVCSPWRRRGAPHMCERAGSILRVLVGARAIRPTPRRECLGLWCVLPAPRVAVRRAPLV